MNEGDDIKAFNENLIDLENLFDSIVDIPMKHNISLPKKFDSIVDIPMKHNIWTYGEEYKGYTNEA